MGSNPGSGIDGSVTSLSNLKSDICTPSQLEEGGGEDDTPIPTQYYFLLFLDVFSYKFGHLACLHPPNICLYPPIYPQNPFYTPQYNPQVPKNNPESEFKNGYPNAHDCRSALMLPVSGLR